MPKKQIRRSSHSDNSQQSDPRTPSKSKVRYAVVGLGHIAQVAVLPAFRSTRNSELVALVSADPEKQKKVARKYRVANVFSYEQYDDALSMVDAVYIALPNHLHREYTVRAAAAGVHVLCEKPMAVTEEECEAMIEAAEQNDVRLMIAYRLHFERGNLEAIKLATSGKLGNLRFFSSDFSQNVVKDNVRVTQPTDRGGGPLYDMGVYCINATRYLFRAEPQEVLAASVNNGEDRFKGVDEANSAILKFPGERLATFTCSFGAADVSRYSLVGTGSVLTSEPAYDYSMAIQHQLTIGEKATKKRFPKRDQFAAEIVYFSDCILRNKIPEPSGQEGLADVHIVRAILESARTGRPIQLSELPGKEKRPGPRQEINRPAHGKPDAVHTKSPSGEAA
jgi:predicted dehydrogenase